MQRNIPDLIQKKGPPLCLLEKPYVVCVRIRECTLNVPEKLAFEKGLRNSSSIHCNERPVFPQAIVMHLPCQQVFSGTVLSSNQNRGLGRSYLRKTATYDRHLIAVAPVHHGSIRQRLRLRISLHCLVPSRRQGGNKFLVFPRLGYEVKSPSAHSFYGQSYVGVCREKDDLCPGRYLLNLLGPIQPLVAIIGAGIKVHVQQHDIRTEGFKH